MSSKTYAVKARKFVVSNPESPASNGQIKQIGRLLRFKATSVDYGNYVAEALELPMTRGEADREIKKLAKCPNRKPVNAPQAIAETVAKLDEQTTLAEIGTLALAGKLGKVAQNKATALRAE